MSKRQKEDTSLQEIVQLLRATRKGQEAAMYGPLRDLFCDILGYPKGSVLIDIMAESGRPDVTCRAPSGIADRNGKPLEIDWIVVEAKDEHDAFSTPAKREAIFGQKSKYIRPDTAWFVMVDPRVLIARPVMGERFDSTSDIVFALTEEVDEGAFRSAFARLNHGVAGVPQRLKQFRQGDTSLIATEKLNMPESPSKRQQNQVMIARRNFYETLRATTSHLQESTLGTFQSVVESANEISKSWKTFSDKYPEANFDPYTLSASARPGSYELALTYGGDLARLNRKLKRAGSVARLALDGLPQFRSRVSAKDEKQVFEMFATETANLILARILLIRFFEDHGFFGPNRFLCNGGVEAFQKLREKFSYGYTRLLKMAYEKAQALYAAAFDETELDWVFATNDSNLSNAIEWAMYQLSRFDFTTVKGDILTGVYDRFLDREQRKRFGEYYTPPSIARYIIDRLDLTHDDRFIDPACGSGTFLIERYQQVVGEDADKGLATYPDVVKALNGISGNDLNTFSAVLAQIQILWHLLSFKDDLFAADEFPDIAISDKANSIASLGTELEKHGRFIELDRSVYAGVGGNPPYVRPERAPEPDVSTRRYFEGGFDRWPGISAEANLYALFVYRALDHWCLPGNKWGEGAGKLGFVLPLAVCGTKENGDLRRLFGPDGRWTIREIVDLEVIWRHVFDADVLPVILIAEARPPRLSLDPATITKGGPLPKEKDKAHRIRAARLQSWIEHRVDQATDGRRAAWSKLAQRNRARWEADRVIIKLADKSCINFGDGTARPSFDLASLTEMKVDYADLFTPDGRIVTRMTPERRAIITKLRANATLASALQEYWYKKSGDARGTVRLDAPSVESFHWEHREMISRGIVFAGKKKFQISGDGHRIYKGENILAGIIFGEPQDQGIDISAARNRYLMEYSSILPERLWAVARIATCPNAVSFNPKLVAFTDTATIFAPKAVFSSVPFDLILTSRVYRYFYAVSCRMSYMNQYRGDIYPANLRLLPWNDGIGHLATALESLRPSLLSACENHFQTEAAIFSALDRLPLRAFKDVFKDHAKGKGSKVEWSESLLKGTDKIELGSGIRATSDGETWKIGLSNYLFDWVTVPDETSALGLAMALSARSGTERRLVDRDSLLNMLIAHDHATRRDFNAILEEFGSKDHAQAIEAVVDRIDALIGPVLGLDDADLASIRREMLEDPFLKNITPRWPSTETRIHGYRKGLDSSGRYD
jgi:SAM-dependent methyltransferase